MTFIRNLLSDQAKQQQKKKKCRICAKSSVSLETARERENGLLLVYCMVKFKNMSEGAIKCQYIVCHRICHVHRYSLIWSCGKFLLYLLIVQIMVSLAKLYCYCCFQLVSNIKYVYDLINNFSRLDEKHDKCSFPFSVHPMSAFDQFIHMIFDSLPKNTLLCTIWFITIQTSDRFECSTNFRYIHLHTAHTTAATHQNLPFLLFVMFGYVICSRS